MAYKLVFVENKSFNYTGMYIIYIYPNLLHCILKIAKPMAQQKLDWPHNPHGYSKRKHGRL
jgi:hypothetical protein